MIRDEILGLWELSNDLLYHKIPKEKINYYISASLDAGKETAKLYQGKNIFELCKEHQITIEYVKESKKNYGVSFRAQTEMDKSGVKIWIYEGSLKELSLNSSYKGRKAISYEEALNIHLAHEFFHYTEYINHSFVSDRLDEIVRLKLPLLTKKSHIQRCSEIAAHKFAKEMLQLNELPNIYDYFYLMHTGQMKETNFLEMIRNSEKLLGTWSEIC
ncbi:MAG: hypothetical protein K0S41_900 [Anaerocolumna sp.]|jgi:hypothetical protein|nr:hypothetical protein [Anaerocolumna sp.]